MRRGIWLGAAILVAMAAAIPLWLALDDDGGRRAAALTETDCSRAEDPETCSALMRRRDEILAAFAALEKQLAATESQIDSWRAKVEAGEPASEAMLEVGKAVAAFDGQVDEVQANVMEWLQQLNAVGDDAQLANVDLQNMLQKQQQTLQMMSNISKALHDSALSAIRNMKG